MKLSNIKKNCMGTVDFDGQFASMRKPQDFIVYPMHEATDKAHVQSDKAEGYISLNDGAVYLGKNHMGFSRAPKVDQISSEELLMLKSAIFATASGMAGALGVYSNNTAAIEVFNI